MLQVQIIVWNNEADVNDECDGIGLGRLRVFSELFMQLAALSLSLPPVPRGRTDLLAFTHKSTANSSEFYG